MPFATWYYPQAVVFKEKVHIGGGAASSDRERQTVIIYDPQQDTYDTLPHYPYKSFSMAVVNNQLVLVGGYDARATNELGVWNEQSETWTHPLPSMTTACCSPSVATHNNRWLVVIGGFGDDDTRLSRVEIFDTESGQWYHAAPIPQPCSHASLAIIGDTCYLVGGFTITFASNKVFSVNLDRLIHQAISQPASAIAPSPWQTLPDTPLANSTALAINGDLLAIGGGGLPWSKDIYQYQPSSTSWVKAGELPIPLSQCACRVLPSGEVFVAGHGDKQVNLYNFIKFN